MNVQKIITPTGETLVVLPIGEYEKLVDAADISNAKQILQDIDNGVDEFVPAELVNKLMEGENPVRVWRKFRKLSAKNLAKQAGISSAYLSEIETGKKSGSAITLKALANALNVDLDDLV